MRLGPSLFEGPCMGLLEGLFAFVAPQALSSWGLCRSLDQFKPHEISEIHDNSKPPVWLY